MGCYGSTMIEVMETALSNIVIIYRRLLTIDSTGQYCNFLAITKNLISELNRLNSYTGSHQDVYPLNWQPKDDLVVSLESNNDQITEADDDIIFESFSKERRRSSSISTSWGLIPQMSSQYLPSNDQISDPFEIKGANSSIKTRPSTSDRRKSISYSENTSAYKFHHRRSSAGILDISGINSTSNSKTSLHSGAERKSTIIHKNDLEELVQSVIPLPDFRQIGINNFDPVKQMSFVEEIKRNRKLASRPIYLDRDRSTTIGLLNEAITSVYLPRIFTDYGEEQPLGETFYPEYKLSPTRVPPKIYNTGQYMAIMIHRAEEEEERLRKEEEIRLEKIRLENELREEQERIERENEARLKLEALFESERKNWTTKGNLSSQVNREIEIATEKLQKGMLTVKQIEEEKEKIMRLSSGGPKTARDFMGKRKRNTLGATKDTRLEIIREQEILKKAKDTLLTREAQPVSATFRAIGVTFGLI
jgi:hypothetical protein